MTHWSTKYLGVPFEDGANGPDSFDCWGFVVHVLKQEQGIELPLYDYGTERDDPGGERAVRKALVAQHRSQYQPIPEPVDGALVLFHVAGRRPHIGICTGVNGVLHMTRTAGAVIMPLDSSRIRNGIDGYYLPPSR